jgi:polyisoprenoid-binding protein YceI
MTPTTHTPPAPAGQLAGSWLVDAAQSQVLFTARGMAGLVKVPGRFRVVAGTLAFDAGAASGVLSLDATSIDTGNRLRDSHLRSSAFLDAHDNPELRYEVDSLIVDGASVSIEGELLVAGTRTRLALAGDLHRQDDDAFEITCRTQLDRVQVGVSGARGMVPRTVDLDIEVVLHRAR